MKRKNHDEPEELFFEDPEENFDNEPEEEVEDEGDETDELNFSRENYEPDYEGDE